MGVEKEITIYDIAEHLELSPATVSRALSKPHSVNKDTRKLILEKASELGYRRNFFARSLRNARTNTIGLVVPRLNTSFMSHVIAGVGQVTNQKGYNLVIRQSAGCESQEIENIKNLYDSGVDGVIVSPVEPSSNAPHFKELANQKRPVVFFDSLCELPQIKNITIDNFGAAYALTRHLIGQGCKLIAYVTPETHGATFTSRLEGYLQALKDNGIVFSDNLILAGGMYEYSGRDVCNDFLKMNPRPDAILFSSDVGATLSMLELRARGIAIPQELCIACFSNESENLMIEYGITTINYLDFELGEIAASTLIQLIENKKDIKLNVPLNFKLMARLSSQRNCFTQ